MKKKIYCSYLYQNCLSESEEAHFYFMELALLMVIAVLRLTSVKNGLSKQEMESLMKVKDCPSFQTIAYNAKNPKERQKSALYALKEFLNKFNANELEKI